MVDEQDMLVGLTIRLTRGQILRLDRLIDGENAKGGRSKTNRQVTCAHFIERGLKEAERER
jgi:hypothetical protein